MSSIRVTWGSRAQSPRDAAEALGSLLAELATISPELEGWYRLGLSPRKGKPVATDLDSLEKLIARGQTKPVDGQSDDESLGCQVGLWSGHDGQVGLGLRVGACGYDAAKNHCELVLPSIDDRAMCVDPRIVDDIALGGDILACLVRAWRPERGAWVEAAWLPDLELAQRDDLGCLVYRRGLTVNEVPDGLVCRRDGEAVIVGQSRPFDPASLEAAQAVQEFVREVSE